MILYFYELLIIFVIIIMDDKFGDIFFRSYCYIKYLELFFCLLSWKIFFN